MAGRLVGGRYRLVRRLGTGGMGAVYLCEHVTLGRRYAVKILHADRATDPELVERFRQEAQAASRIAQENVVDVIDCGQDEGGDLYYVMEMLEGRTLGQLIRQDAPLPVSRALGLLEQVCRALTAAHAGGVVHRDVKPENILVEQQPDGTERVKLIDFGISHVPGTGRLTRDGEIIGTPEYMAPEQASGAEVDALTDVYAVGVLAFELLTGSLPLVGPTAIATLVAHQSQPPPAPGTRREGIPPELDRLVLRALAKRPEDRFASMQVLTTEVMRVRLAVNLASLSGTGTGTGERIAARFPTGGGWTAPGPTGEASTTGRGGTLALTAMPYPVLPADPPPAAAPGSATDGADEGLRGRAAGRWALLAAGAALLLALLVGASLLTGTAAPPARRAAPPETPSGQLVAPPALAPSASAPSTAPAPEAPPPGGPRAAAPEEPAPVAAPEPVEAAPRAAPPRAGVRPASPASKPDALRDPYASPDAPLKPDPFR